MAERGKTCGPMYLDALTKHAGTDPALARVFAAGFINGQAEKVYLGACRACMFRPSPERMAMILELASDAAGRYSLFLRAYGEEVWLLRDNFAAAVLENLMTAIEPNSGSWHVERGFLCGIPSEELDTRFHERKGFGEPCDMPTEAQP